MLNKYIRKAIAVRANCNEESRHAVMDAVQKGEMITHQDAIILIPRKTLERRLKPNIDQRDL